MKRFMATGATLLLLTTGAHAGLLQPGAHVGQAWEISRDVETVQRSSDGSASGRSTDRDTLVARVVAVRDTGLELEYDLPDGSTADDRGRRRPLRIAQKPGGRIDSDTSTETVERRSLSHHDS